MANSNPPLDELMHSRPEIIQWWVTQMGGHPMDANIIHRYFSESPFFDWSTKNGLYFTQAANDISMWNISNDRVRFEDYLRKRVGVEYMIVAEPQPVADKDLAGQGVTTGVWVIRKQDRQRASEARTRPGKFLEGDWQIEVLGTYFIVGENVYQAPSVFSIIENRLLSAMSSLHKMMDATSALPRYTPAAGYSYLPQSQSTKQTTSTSVAGTPARSREGSVAPGTDAQSLRSASVLPESQITSSATASNYEETRLLADSLRMTILYGDEYADENPIKGEPGSFTFSSSTAAVKKRRADEEAAEAKARAERELLNTSRAASPKVEFKVTAPSAFTTETKVTTTKGEKSGKSSKSGDKVKRRRSKAPSAGPSPTTPGGPLIGTPSSTT